MITITMLILLSAPIVKGYLDDYHCGVGRITKTISYGLSTFCGREKLNRCCEQHDVCYGDNCDALSWKYAQCDNTFGDCIDRSYGRFCGFVLGASHSGVSKVFGGFYRAWEGDQMSWECRMKKQKEEEERRKREEQERLEHWERQELLVQQQIERQRQELLIQERLRQQQLEEEQRQLRRQRLQFQTWNRNFGRSSINRQLQTQPPSDSLYEGSGFGTSD